MKIKLLVVLTVFISSHLFAQTEYEKNIQLQRDTINMEFGDEEESILKEEDLKGFEGLHFYNIDETFRVKFKFKKIKKGKEFKMKTSTTRLPSYKPYGYLKFKINGEKCKLMVYQSTDLSKTEGYEDYLFVPFTDKTSGETSYGGGRYLDITIGDLSDKDFYLDFNVCYNPYCAYSEKYSCPIPPSENYLDVSILAGAKKWHD